MVSFPSLLYLYGRRLSVISFFLMFRLYSAMVSGGNLYIFGICPSHNITFKVFYASSHVYLCILIHRYFSSFIRLMPQS